MTEEEAQGGRIFFSSTGRTFGEEDELCVLSVGVDIGSSTSHLVFSRIVLERLDSRYVVTQRETFYQSDILLPPHASADEIDADAPGAFLPPQQCAPHRRAVCRAGRQARRGERGRQPGDRDGRLWVGRGRTLDPR